MSWVTRFAGRVRGFARRATLAAANFFLGPLRAPSAGLLLGAGLGLGALGQGYGELPSRLTLDWAPDDLRQALAEADGGSLSLAADLCESLIGADDRAPAVVGTRVKAVSGAPLTFEAAATGRLRRRALKAAQAEEDWWEMLPNDELEELRRWRLVLGVGLGELVWTEEDPVTGETVARVRSGRHVPRLKVWYPGFLRLDPLTGRWLLRTGDLNEIEITPGDGKWVLLTLGSSAPWRRGLWRALAALVLLKSYARDDWAGQAEKYAKGIYVVTVPEGGEETERKKLAREISELASEGVIVLDRGMDAKVVELQARSWETFQAQIALANTSMSVTAIGTNLPTEVTAGAGTGATAQGAVRQDYLEADAARDEVDLRAQVMKPWSKLNFGNAELAPWPVYRVVPPDDLARLATTWKTVFEALKIAKDAQAPISIIEVLQRFDIPVGATSPAPATPVPLAALASALAGELGDMGAACARLAGELGAPLSRAEVLELVRLPFAEAANDFAAMFQPALSAPRRKAA